MEGTIRILQERNLNNPTNKSVAPIYPVTKAEAVLNSDGKTMEEITSDLDERLTAAEEAIDIGEVGKTLTLTEENWEKYAVGPGRTPAHIDLSRLKITKLVIKNGVHYPIYITLPSTIETIDSSEYNHPISWHTNTSAAVANLKKVISYDGSELALYALKTVPELPEETQYLTLPTGSITISNPKNSYSFNTTQELYNVLYYCITSLSNYTGELTTVSSSSTYPESSLFWGSDIHKSLQQIWAKAYPDLSTTPSFNVNFYCMYTRLSALNQSGNRHLNNTLACNGTFVPNGGSDLDTQVPSLGRFRFTTYMGSYPQGILHQVPAERLSREDMLKFNMEQATTVTIVEGKTYNISGSYGESNSDYFVTINSRTYVTHSVKYIPSYGDYVFADASMDSEEDKGKTVIGTVLSADSSTGEVVIRALHNLGGVSGTNSVAFGPAVYGTQSGGLPSYAPDIDIFIGDNLDGKFLQKLDPEKIYDNLVANNMPTELVNSFSWLCDALGYTDLDANGIPNLDPMHISILFMVSIVLYLSKDPENNIEFPENIWNPNYEESLSSLRYLMQEARSSDISGYNLLYFAGPFVTYLFDGLHYSNGLLLDTTKTITLREGEVLDSRFSRSHWFIAKRYDDYTFYDSSKQSSWERAIFLKYDDTYHKIQVTSIISNWQGKSVSSDTQFKNTTIPNIIPITKITI